MVAGVSLNNGVSYLGGTRKYCSSSGCCIWLGRLLVCSLGWCFRYIRLGKGEKELNETILPPFDFWQQPLQTSDKRLDHRWETQPASCFSFSTWECSLHSPTQEVSQNIYTLIHEAKTSHTLTKWTTYTWQRATRVTGGSVIYLGFQHLTRMNVPATAYKPEEELKRPFIREVTLFKKQEKKSNSF